MVRRTTSGEVTRQPSTAAGATAPRDEGESALGDPAVRTGDRAADGTASPQERAEGQRRQDAGEEAEGETNQVQQPEQVTQPMDKDSFFSLLSPETQKLSGDQQKRGEFLARAVAELEREGRNSSGEAFTKMVDQQREELRNTDR